MKIFSIPLNPKLSEKEFYIFLDFCKQYKDFIYDIYFTCRIPPFLQDAMGDIFIQTEDNLTAIDTALYLQQETGIPISATFNNIEVRPDQKNLDLLIKHFKPLYDKGIRSCTIPHTSWMLTGQIQHNFPDLFVKNTILRMVSEPREVAELAKAGFHYINLDRNLMRDHDRLREIKKVKEKFNVQISLLANEGCLGGCPIMEEHFSFNNTRTDGPQFFNDPISRISCSKWENENTAWALKAANFPPWKEDWLELLNELGIDTFKMHGRESITRLFETMEIIKKFANDEEILFDKFDEYIAETNLDNKPINIWREKIKTCKFDCWDCDYCDRVWKAKGNKVNSKVSEVVEILANHINLPEQTYKIQGLTSDRVRKLLNSLGKISANYLEIGCAAGATFAATILDNSLSAFGVDNWKSGIVSADNTIAIPASKEIFIENIKKIKGKNKIKIYDCNYWQVDTAELPNMDLFFYDAEHDYDSTISAVKYFGNKFSTNAILVFDDANWEGVVSGANEGIRSIARNILFSRLILNEQESEQNWWNGLYIVILD